MVVGEGVGDGWVSPIDGRWSVSARWSLLFMFVVAIVVSSW